MSHQCLVIHETGMSCTIPDCFQVEIRFNPRIQGRNVTVTTTQDSKMIVSIAEAYRQIRGEFDEQILNRLFTDQVLRIRPKFIYISYVCGATLDLMRLAKILGTIVITSPPASELMPLKHTRAFTWLLGAISSADVLICSSNQQPDCLTIKPTEWTGDIIQTSELCKWMSEHEPLANPDSQRTFDYGLYEFGLRDHALLRDMQKVALPFFEKSTRVLDLASGAGIFLDLLESSGIKAEGVERNPALVKYSRDIGLHVHEADALVYLRSLAKTSPKYDGIHCSHFIEHLPISAVEDLIFLIFSALSDGGVLVLIFPDPESIRSQLLGFWRDPEHVRFYHADLIEIMARAVGFELIYSNIKSSKRDVISFSPQMDSWPKLSTYVPTHTEQDGNKPKWWKRFISPPSSEVNLLKEEIAQLNRRIESIEERSRVSEQTSEKLWTVNQTWAWDDNVTLCFKKMSKR